MKKTNHWLVARPKERALFYSVPRFDLVARSNLKYQNSIPTGQWSEPMTAGNIKASFNFGASAFEMKT